MADPTPDVIATSAANTVTEVDAGAAKHVEPELFGLLAPYQVVSIAMLVLIGIMLWKGVHKLIARSLDDRIAAIREQLDEARTLRSEAETLRDEYALKVAGAEKDAEAMLANARVEAEALVVQAEKDSATMVARREAMAEDKIAAAERAALDDVRTKAANAATQASRRLIARKHDAAADARLADEVIASL